MYSYDHFSFPYHIQRRISDYFKLQTVLPWGTRIVAVYLNSNRFTLLWTEKHGFDMYCEQMHSISKHCAYSV